MPESILPWESAEPVTLAHRVASVVAREIVEQRCAAGDLITEIELAKRQGVSRTPVREAMLQLESWGLVRLMPKKGAIVTAVSAAERRDLLDVRTLFEIDSVTTLARVDVGLSSVAGALDAALAEQQQALNDGALLRFAAADYRFHARVILAGGNAVVASVLAGLGPRLARLTHQVCIERPESLPVLLDEHQTLAQLARAGDAAEFADLIRAHIHDTHFPQEQRA